MKYFLLFALILGLTINLQSQENSKTKKIHELLELTGSAKLGVQVIHNMLNSFKTSFKEVDEKFWDEFAAEIKGEDLVELIIPIYDKYYTETDIDQMIVFYKSPVGRKITETLPAITSESMVVGQAWGQQISSRVISRLKEKGYLKD